MATSFISEHSAELILVPKLIDEMTSFYHKITPVYFWSSRKGGLMSKSSSASTTMKNAGVSPHYIKESLGHTSLKTIENYLAGFENEQRKEFAKVLENFKQFNVNTDTDETDWVEL